VHTVSGFLLEQSANIEEAAQYNDQATGLFFMRVQFACAAHDLASLKAAFAALAEPLQMRWSIHPRAERMKTVIMVSRQGHCLNDLLFRFKSGLLPVDIRAIISNHRDFYNSVSSPLYYIPGYQPAYPRKYEYTPPPKTSLSDHLFETFGRYVQYFWPSSPGYKLRSPAKGSPNRLRINKMPNV
jgi:hypothetical protein